MVSRKSAYLVIGGTLLLAACGKKTDSQPVAVNDTANATAIDAANTTTTNAAMLEDLGNDSNATAPAAPAKLAPHRARRGNPDTRGTPVAGTTTQ